MARISLDPPRTLLTRIASAYSKRQYGAVMDPLNAMAHNRKVLLSNARFEMSLAKWKTLDPQLKELAIMASSHRVGCTWCTDFGYWIAHSAGIDEAKLRDVPQWRTSKRFSELERQVLEYAELMSGETADIPDELVTALRDALGDEALVELTMMIAVENLRSRFNSALGLTSQGFAERCEVRA